MAINSFVFFNFNLISGHYCQAIECFLISFYRIRLGGAGIFVDSWIHCTTDFAVTFFADY